MIMIKIKLKNQIKLVDYLFINKENQIYFLRNKLKEK